MMGLKEVLQKAVNEHASDIFIVAGGYLSYKVDGEIRPLNDEAKLMPAETEQLIDEIFQSYQETLFG